MWILEDESHERDETVKIELRDNEENGEATEGRE
jgi:hypothetical protein